LALILAFSLVSQDLSFLLIIAKKVATKPRKSAIEAAKFEMFFYASAHFPSLNAWS